MEDQAIIDLYWKRRENAIEESEKKYGKYCYTVSYNILQNNEDAEECVNDTWVGAWKSMPPQRPARLATFLGKITRNLSLNRLKQNGAAKRGTGQTELALAELEECVPSHMNTEQSFDEAITVQSINAFLYAQSEKKRNIFLRRYWYLYSVKDIALCYNVSESKVASILFRMRKDLKTHLEKEGIIL